MTTPATQAASVDAEALIRACVPGGSSCDPQAVADSIRAFLTSTSAAPSRDSAATVRRPFFAHDPDNGLEWYPTLDEAVQAATRALAEYRKDARADGEWPAEAEDVRVGHVTHAAISSGDEESGWDYSLRALSAASSSAPAAPQQQARLTEWVERYWKDHPVQIEEAFYAHAEHEGLDTTSDDGGAQTFADDATEASWKAWNAAVKFLADAIEREAASLHAGDAAGQATPGEGA